MQEQHSLQRVEGYAVYYEKNPSMQEFLVAQNRHTEPPRVEGEGISAKREDVAQNYRAILNKLNEKPAKKNVSPLSMWQELQFWQWWQRQASRRWAIIRI